MFPKKKKDPGLVLLPVTNLDIEQVRERCRALVRKRAMISAGMAAVPVPGIDMVADLSSFAGMV